MRCSKYLLAFAVLGSGLAPLAAATVHGVVFDDRNGNGVRDPGEPGLAAVGVSNGRDIVLTDAGGRYEISAEGGDIVFVVKPRGWRPETDARNLPRFYLRPAAGAAPEGADFPLVRADEPDDFKVLVFTDTQPASPREVGYLNRTLVDGLAGRRDFAFGVTLGDVVFDRPDLYAPVNEALARIGIPWHSLNGNHDLDLGAHDDRGSVATFESVYGPSTYAFYCGRVLFIALDDVRFLGGPRYVGGLRPDQFAFLENLLRAAPPDVLIVPMMHIPLFSTDSAGADTFRAADRTRLFALLRDRPHLLVLSGHTHSQRHVFHGPSDGWQGAVPLHEYNVAAADGGFWGGPPDAQGIPIATMGDGTPPGYAVLTFNGADVQTEYRAGRHPAGYQIALHVPKSIAPLQGYVSFYANVFDGHDGWTVEARVDDRNWTPMRRIPGWDPSYAELYLAQDDAVVPPSSPRLPDPVICAHLWRAYLPPDLTRGAHTLTVRATEPGGRSYTATDAFEVSDPVPE